MKCSECSYWDKDSYATNGSDMGMCYKFSELSVKDAENTKAEAICYGEGIGGEFITMPDFGCVEFELIS